MKEIIFLGSSLKVIRQFSDGAKRAIGYQLDRVQHGLLPTDWKPMTTVGQGVREIRIKYGMQYRVIYVASFQQTIYVLHAFQKKTQKTRLQDIMAAKNTLKQLS